MYTTIQYLFLSFCIPINETRPVCTDKLLTSWNDCDILYAISGVILFQCLVNIENKLLILLGIFGYLYQYIALSIFE